MLIVCVRWVLCFIAGVCVVCSFACLVLVLWVAGGEWCVVCGVCGVCGVWCVWCVCGVVCACVRCAVCGVCVCTNLFPIRGHLGHNSDCPYTNI